MPSIVRSIFPSPALEAGCKVVVLGTSLVQQSNAATSAKISNWSKGWVNWLKILGPEFRCSVWHDTADRWGRNFSGANHGVSGQTTAEIISRIMPVLAMRPDIVILDCGTNEIGANNVDTVYQAFAMICDTLRQAGIQVVVLPILARATSAWATDSANNERKKAHAVNQLKKAYAAANGCFYYDWNQDWVDYGNTNGEPRAGFSDDGTHYNVRGAFSTGRGAAQFLSTILQPRQPSVVSQDDIYDPVHNVYGNVFPNANMLGTAGTLGTAASGVVPTSMRVERTVGAAVTVACSQESRGAGLGNWLALTFTPGGTASERFLVRSATADVTHNMPVGTWIEGAVDVSIPNAYDGWKSHQLYVKDQGSGVVAFGNEEYDMSGLQPQPDEAWSGRIPIEPFQLGEGVGALALRMRFEIELLGSVAGSPVIKLGSFVVRPTQNPRYLWY